MRNKDNFLNELNESLYFFSPEEKSQVIADYEELIIERNNDGEDIQNIIASLDTPDDIAKNYASELGIKYSIAKKYIANTKNKSQSKFNEFKNRDHKKSKVTQISDALVYFLITTGLIIKSIFKFFLTLFLYVTLICLIVSLILFLVLFNFDAYNFMIKSLITIGVGSGISINVIMIYGLNKYLGKIK